MKNTVLKDEKSIPKNTPEVDVISLLKADKNRWHLIAIFLICLVAIEGMYANDANNRAELNTEVIYIKMYPDGTWHVEQTTPQSVQDFYNTTVDKLLTDYVVRRYGIVPATIRNDYGTVINFMSPQLAANFTSDKEDGFNAAQKAADVLSKPDFPTHEIKVGVKDHYDKGTANFNNTKGEVIRTNIYFTEQEIAPNGAKDPAIKRYILSMTWHLLTPEELKGKSRDYFMANPIGIEIIKEEKYLDPAAQNPK